LDAVQGRAKRTVASSPKGFDKVAEGSAPGIAYATPSGSTGFRVAVPGALPPATTWRPFRAGQSPGGHPPLKRTRSRASFLEILDRFFARLPLADATWETWAFHDPAVTLAWINNNLSNIIYNYTRTVAECRRFSYSGNFSVRTSTSGRMRRCTDSSSIW